MLVTSRFYCVLFCSLYLAICATNQMALAQGETAADIIAGYKQNASQFLGSRILYKTQMKHIDQKIPSVYLYDYWTDKSNVLFRGGDLSPRYSEVDESFLLSIPPDEITSEDLEKRYRNTSVQSFCASEKAAFYWQGYSRKKTIPGVETIKSMENGAKGTFERRSSFNDSNSPTFPPMVPFSNNKWRLYPSDIFFSLPEEDMYILGTAIVDNIECVILENRSMYPKNHWNLSKEKLIGTKYENCELQAFYSYIACVDVQRGCIPIHIQERVYWIIDGTIKRDDIQTLLKKKDCASLLEVKEIKQDSQGAFYPAYTIYQKYTYHPQKLYLPKTIEDFVDQVVPPGVKSVVYSEDHWEILHVKPHVKISEATLKIPYPRGTSVYDLQDQKGHLAGYTDEEYEAYLHKLDSGKELDTSESFPANRKRLWILAVNVLLMVLAVGYGAYRFRKRNQDVG